MKKGDFRIGGTYPVEDPRHDRIKKGRFLTSDGGAVEAIAERHEADQALRRSYPYFEQTLKDVGPPASEIERMKLEHHKAAIQELTRRFLAVRAQLDAVKSKTRK